MISFCSLTRASHKWARTQFGALDSPLPPLKHLQKEVEELCDTPFDRMEYADCLILLMDAAQIAGLTPEDILMAIEDKLHINREREWGKPDKDGIVEHIR